MKFAVAAAAIAASLSLAPVPADGARTRTRHLPYPTLAFPLVISGSQYAPLAWGDITGWNDDDHLAAYKCVSHQLQGDHRARPDRPPIRRHSAVSLRDPCRAARASDIADSGKARAFFEQYFLPLQISRLGEEAGFVTGYYEPIIDGSLTRTDIYNVPVYRRPSNLFVRGFKQDAPSLPNNGAVYRKIGRRKLVAYYDRAQIEDGAIAGRGLEICWLKDPTDLLFSQIQGSARVHLEDGTTIRINYDAHNGYPYTPVGRVLIDRGIIPKDQMSMQKIRDWMEQNPDGAKDLRRANRAYVFFREVQLSDKDEAVGAQGVPLTPGRSIAVDKSLHVYGTPFFIEGVLPIESDQSKTPFRRLMIAQDTGSAITGPARADLYFGAGADAARVSGRLKNNMHFVMLVPKSLDPTALGRKMPVPDPRPSAKIARLYPQVDPLKDPKASASTTSPAAAAAASSTQADAAQPVPLPAARPDIKPDPEPRRQRHRHHRGEP